MRTGIGPLEKTPVGNWYSHLHLPLCNCVDPTNMNETGITTELISNANMLVMM